MEPGHRNCKAPPTVYINNMYYTGGFYCWTAYFIVDNTVAA